MWHGLLVRIIGGMMILSGVKYWVLSEDFVISFFSALALLLGISLLHIGMEIDD